MGLKLVFLIVTRAVSLPGLSRREWWWKDGAKVCVLAVIGHGTRRIRILGATGHPVQSRLVRQARNLLTDLGDAPMSVKFVLHDRDASFTAASGAVFQAAGVRVVRSAIQAPRMNSIMERWIGSCPRRDRAGGVIHEYCLVA